jgi:hypothetical protein
MRGSQFPRLPRRKRRLADHFAVLGSTSLGGQIKEALTFAGIQALATMVAGLAGALAFARIDAKAMDLLGHGSVGWHSECCSNSDCEGSGGESSAGL